MHFHRNSAAAFAGLAAAAGQVVTEAAIIKALQLGLRQFGEKPTDFVKHAREARGRAARSPRNRALVHQQHFAVLLLATACLEFLLEARVDFVHDHGALARARYTANHANRALRELYRQILKVVMIQFFEFVEFRGIGNGLCRNLVCHRDGVRQILDSLTARKLLQGVRLGKLFGRTFGNDFTAELTRRRTHIDNMVCRLHHLHVVFHDHERIAEVAQAVKRIEQHGGIAFVQAHRRFVKHIEHTFETATDLTRQANTLGFTARERVARAVETDVTEAYTLEEIQSAHNFAEQRFGDRHLAIGILVFPEVVAFEVFVAEPFERLGDTHVVHIHNILVADVNRQIFRLQTFAVAIGANFAVLKVAEAKAGFASAPMRVKAEVLRIQG